MCRAVPLEQGTAVLYFSKNSKLENHCISPMTHARAGCPAANETDKAEKQLEPESSTEYKMELYNPTCKSSGASGRGPTKVAAPPWLPPSSSLPIDMPDMGLGVGEGVGAYISPGA